MRPSHTQQARVSRDLARTGELVMLLANYLATDIDEEFAAVIRGGLYVPSRNGYPDSTLYPPPGHSFPAVD